MLLRKRRPRRTLPVPSRNRFTPLLGIASAWAIIDRMSSRIALLASLASVLAFFLPAVFAHDLWLEADSFRVPGPGELVLVRAGNGTIYGRSENAVSPDRIARLILLGPGGAAVDPPIPEVQGDWLHLAFTPQAAGTYSLALATRPNLIRLTGEEFTEYLMHDGIPAVLRQREQDGISGRDEVEQYSKYVKALLQVGSTSADDCSRPLGLEIEILPLENPSGGSISCRWRPRITATRATGPP
jgi:hypothetical protein